MIGLRDDAAAFFLFLATVVFIVHVVLSFSYLLSCAVGDAAVATALGGPVIVPFMLFGGFMLNDS